ncbi:HutD/Ves family protein [Paraburkholderia saeva]|uniref:Protein Ves n=1 Tax=Paraburkholderia saeva TaxID=2777537 RepID=A0A9N8X3G3_9BURK|nr:HutD family protein [Paraburkholderia saeva]CAG4890937.1 Protein Ves [Paraburkholderia saeva]CAG4896606.1 Protein Ves [Paraburkholderia saeva]CAG4901718.1 Protein Ves [Paraburkholderia saeva]
MPQALNTTQVSLLRGADLVASPWKNGGGVTREIAVEPQGAALDTFVWRVSVADVAQPGPFSRFAGIDRTLVLLSGAGMLLDDAEGHTHALTQPLDIARFKGEASIDARLVDGATRDFNLMVRRGAATGDVEVWRGESQQTLTADVVLLFCAAGAAEITFNGRAPFLLTHNDTLRIDAAHALACTVKCVKADTEAGAILAIGVRYT